MKKGFTLIELLSVIIILAIILVIVVPQVLKTLNLSKEKSFLAQIQLYEKATELYISDKVIKGESIDDYVTLEFLKEKGYVTEVKENIKGIIKIIKNNNEYEIEFIEINDSEGEVVYVDSSRTISNIVIEGNTIQETSVQGKNMIPTNFEEYENGHYSMTTGLKDNHINRIRVPFLTKVVPSTQYYFSITHPQASFVIRSYNANKEFLRNKSVIKEGVMSSSSDEHYFSISIYNINEQEYEPAFENNELVPIMYLNSETNKDFEPYIPNMPTPEYYSEIKSIENANLILKDCNLFEVDNMSLTNSSKINDVISLNQLTFDRILRETQWQPKESTKYTLVLDIIENTFDNSVTIRTDNRFYFLNNFGSVPSNTTGRFVFTSTTRDDFSSVTLGSLWFHSANTITGNFRFRMKILEGEYNANELNNNYSCKNPIKRTIELPILRKLETVSDTYNLITGNYIKRIEEASFYGIENWVVSGIQPNFPGVRYDVAKGSNNGALDYYVLNTHFKYNNVNIPGSWVNINTNLQGRVFWDYDTVEELKTFLAEEHSKNQTLQINYKLLNSVNSSLNSYNSYNFKDVKYIYFDSDIKGEILIEY